MDKYSKSTIELLLETNKDYLVEILSKLSIDAKSGQVNKESLLTVESVSALLTNKKYDYKKDRKSSIYECKCSSKLVIVREVQSRSTDEGSTVRYYCKECGNTW